MIRSLVISLTTFFAIITAPPLAAQGVRSVDPSAVLSAPAAPPVSGADDVNGDLAKPDNDASAAVDPATAAQSKSAAPATTSSTFKRDDLIGAAEGVFGKGAQGLAGLIEKVLKDQGEPNAYIAGREVSGAFVVGLRYGSGTLKHSVEGERPVYWTGPSVGFDVGGDATKTFVLVYNLYDSQDLYKRYPQAEGRAYFVGGFSATYLRRGSVVLIPVRLGVGVRLGANIGYMKFSEKSKWLPF
ncbi:MAG: DUF1134 domain-containing protein [Sphingomonadaceae bacterium]